jgi:hypothetical protein
MTPFLKLAKVLKIIALFINDEYIPNVVVKTTKYAAKICFSLPGITSLIQFNSILLLYLPEI